MDWLGWIGLGIKLCHDWPGSRLCSPSHPDTFIFWKMARCNEGLILPLTYGTGHVSVHSFNKLCYFNTWATWSVPGYSQNLPDPIPTVVALAAFTAFSTCWTWSSWQRWEGTYGPCKFGLISRDHFLGVASLILQENLAEQQAQLRKKKREVRSNSFQCWKFILVCWYAPLWLQILLATRHPENFVFSGKFQTLCKWITIDILSNPIQAIEKDQLDKLDKKRRKGDAGQAVATPKKRATKLKRPAASPKAKAKAKSKAKAAKATGGKGDDEGASPKAKAKAKAKGQSRKEGSHDAAAAAKRRLKAAQSWGTLKNANLPLMKVPTDSQLGDKISFTVKNPTGTGSSVGVILAAASFYVAKPVPPSQWPSTCTHLEVGFLVFSSSLVLQVYWLNWFGLLTGSSKCMDRWMESGASLCLGMESQRWHGNMQGPLLAGEWFLSPIVNKMFSNMHELKYILYFKLLDTQCPGLRI